MVYSIALGLAIVASIISTVGGATYLAWNLSAPALVAVAVASSVASFFVLRFIFKKVPGEPTNEPEPSRWWTVGLLPLFALIGICFWLLVKSSTTASLNTPWKAVSPLFWPALVLAGTAAGALLPRLRRSAVFLALAGMVAVGVSVATIVYSTGYGFDPFIHQAAEKYILAHDLLLPRTPYYNGQYALVVLLARATGWSVHLIDIWLLPALAALGVAGSAVYAARAQGKSAGYFAMALLALFPLAPFINTTPFGLACLYAVLAAILGLAVPKNPRLLLAIWLFALASAFTHPIAGVPALVLAVILQFKKPLLKILAAVGGALALPALFAISSGGLHFNWDGWHQISLPIELPISRFRSLGDIIYALGAVAVIAIIVGVCRKLDYFIAAGSATVAGIAIAICIDFSYLPAYEQGGYPGRLLVVALLIAAPAAAWALAEILRRGQKAPLLKLGGIAVVATLFVGGIYLAYPREDAYVISKGWNTSDSDIASVKAIAASAGNEPYIVLASQTVSAAALNEFGFFKYYPTPAGEIFAYPVPTGGALYPYYLKMVYDEPSGEYAKQAMELAGVKRAYLVVNTYWTGSDHIIARAKSTSRKWFAVNEADYIFEYGN